MNKYAVQFLIWGIGVSLGFGGSQLMFIMPVKEQLREHNIRMTNVEKDNSRQDFTQEAVREDFTKRLTTLVSEQANYVSIAREFIASSRSDRELIMQQIKQNAELITLLKGKGT